jgi:hypothetical protein
MRRSGARGRKMTTRQEGAQAWAARQMPGTTSPCLAAAASASEPLALSVISPSPYRTSAFRLHRSFLCASHCPFRPFVD